MPKQAKRRRRKVESDDEDEDIPMSDIDEESEDVMDESESELDDDGGFDDDDDDDDDDGGRPKKRRKAGGKRSLMTSTADLQYHPELLIEDDEDRAMLDAMNELDREQELMRRFEVVKQKTQDREILEMAKQKDKEKRQKRKPGKSLKDRASALESLAKGRRRKQRVDDDEEESEFDEDEEDDLDDDLDDDDDDEGDYNDDAAPVRGRGRGQRGSRGRVSADLEEERPDEIVLADLKEAQVRRSRAEDWAMEPFFTEAMTGALVRVAATNGAYAIGQVTAVETGKRYTLASGIPCDKYLVVTNRGKELTIDILRVSDGPIDGDDYRRFKLRYQGHELQLPDPYELRRKAKELLNYQKYQLTDDMITRMTDQKRERGDVAFNYVVERQRKREELRLELAKEGDERDEDLIERLQTRIETLNRIHERQLEQRNVSKHAKINDITRRNRETNAKLARELNAQMRQNKALNTGGDFDPFSRRPTKPSIICAPDAALAANKPDAADAAKTDAKAAEKSAPPAPAADERPVTLKDPTFAARMFKERFSFALPIDLGQLPQAALPPIHKPAPLNPMPKKAPAGAPALR